VFGKKKKFSILKQGDARLEQISFKAHNLPQKEEEEAGENSRVYRGSSRIVS
jgi:hypothetical protein